MLVLLHEVQCNKKCKMCAHSFTDGELHAALLMITALDGMQLY